MKQSCQKQQGFTLIEIIVVVVIIGILSGVALPNFLAQRDKAKVAAANAAAAGLVTACEVAITSDIDVTLDTEVVRVEALLPDDAAAGATATLTSPDGCVIAVSGTAVTTDGSFTAFGDKTPGLAQ